VNQEAIEARRRDIQNQLGPLRRQHQAVTRDIVRLEEELVQLQREEGRYDTC